ncbi:TetR/AcrR family transcriptional regulator [Pseudomonas sp. ICMP 561]|uniref:TetR/AcrR family transcriptional regulator n=1 Tax=Pseudomonas sp. ICMP 561 TaxID=1718918 RepID=UPI000C068BA3|nr:TetR/AcrR family transcriptional regulator [Pseudomonas sp. ICMP 561]PHN17099.1 TetR family transcriptional regulator [Pseudomonas sp. ICMP 561]
MSSQPSNAKPRQRMSREGRLSQLLEVAWQIVREEGTESLTLGHLAQMAGVTKPVVYDHFPTRPLLLARLYADFDVRQTSRLDEALRNTDATVQARARVIADSYVDCVLLQGREIPGVIAALSSSPELEKIKRDYELIFMDKCRAALGSHSKPSQISNAQLRAMLGAADALSNAAAVDEISADEAKSELYEIILAMTERAH